MSFFTFLLACNPPKNEEKEKEVQDDTVYLNTTEFDFPSVKVPYGFELDDISFTDSVKSVSFYFSYLKEKRPEDSAYNSCIYKTLLNQIQQELIFYDTVWDSPYTIKSSLIMMPVKINVGEKLISIKFIQDSFSEGGAHHNYSWYCLNYDRKNRKMLNSVDVFKFNSFNDTLDYWKLISRNLDEQRSEDLGTSSDSVAFFILNDSIELCPDLSWSSGMRYAKLPFDSLTRFFTKKFNNRIR